MNVTCDKCNKRYSIADDKVRGKSVKIRCKQCQNLISVQGPTTGAAAAAPAAAGASASASVGVEMGAGAQAGALGSSPWEEERTRAMPAMDATAQWFAMVKGKQLGPLDLKGLEGKVKTGELTLRTYLWRQGMGDWKRASEVPEVSPVFAGVSVGATATGPLAAAATERPSSKRVPAVQRDVAVALETPSPEITRKPNGNGNGNGGHAPAPAAAQPMPEPAPAPAPRAKVPSKSQAGVARAAAPAPAPEPAVQNVALQAPLPDALPTAPIPGGTPAPLSDLFGDQQPISEQGPLGTLDGEANGGAAAEDPNAVNDPFAALGPADPSMAPAPGEATKFFIAQAGVNKRNPPWKIALFVIGAPGLIVGVLFLLSTLHIVPLEVTRTNEKGEEVKESFFSAGGVSGIKDIFSGDAAKKKAEAEAKKQALLEKKRRDAIAARGNDNNPPDPKADPNKPEKAEPKTNPDALALIYGNGTPEKETKGPRVRPEDRQNGAAKDTSGGLSQEASQKVIADKLKAFEDCVAQALRRNPNLAVGNIDVVLNVGASGAVTSSTIVPAKHNNSDWGSCMRDVGKRIVFPKSDGETEVAIPLKVGVAL